MVIRLFTLFTPFTSLTSLVTRSFSAALRALPDIVITPSFVSTLVLRALVERWNSNVILTWAVMNASSIFPPTLAKHHDFHDGQKRSAGIGGTLLCFCPAADIPLAFLVYRYPFANIPGISSAGKGRLNK